MHASKQLAAAAILFIATGCGDRSATRSDAPTSQAGGQGNSEPSESTRRANSAVRDGVDLANQQDFEDAKRGLIVSEPDLVIRADDGRVVWDPSQYAFEQGDAPDSVNPSLWRQAQLNNRHGLYQVSERVYQVRGYDLANMSIILGESGWILVDPLTSRETAAAALEMARKQLGDAPIRAVILTHSHIDHFGGMQAVVSPEDVTRGVKIIAPLHMVEAATSENVLAGIAMGRRAGFMYGFGLERGPRGHVGSGLGKEPAQGRFGILPPTDIVDHTGQEMLLDGVRFVFTYAPGSEAPAELTFYLPEWKTYCGAEIVSHNMHNVYTLRGAKVRNPLEWSGYIQDVIHRFPDVETLFASHHWPTWGNERVIDFLKKQRDLYKFIHDQTLRLVNEGYTSREIAEMLEMPESLARFFPDRGYYGTLRHNSKAVYQLYFGWYDGNPANLDPLPPVPAAEKYVEFMGGRDAVLEKARASHDAGDYRWTATVLNHLVFAQPEDSEAKELLAQTYDQLGYRAESAPWRDVYLTGALELRQGITGSPLDPSDAVDLLRHLPMPRFFDALAARVNGPKAEGKQLVLNFVFTDIGQSYVLSLENSVLNYWQMEPDPDANVTVRLTRELWLGLVTRTAGLRDVIFSDDLQVEGSRLDLLAFFRLLDQPRGNFAIVTP
jgi:alkyl sulfatase BDS1-like metallo-beta-lactamase superfamily hydrolase